MDNKDFNDISYEMYLTGYEKFINIDNQFNGGHQNWLYTQGYTSKFWADRSCGVVAAANYVYYLSLNNNFENLYAYTTLSKADFSNHIRDIYKYLRPTIFGIPILSYLAKGVTRFAKSKGVNLNPVYSSMDWTFSNVIDYIIKGLEDDKPILMLTWNTKVRHLKNHWVTIIGYVKTKENNHFLITSNWGKIEIFSLDKWFYSYSLYKGLIYFNKLK